MKLASVNMYVYLINWMSINRRLQKYTFILNSGASVNRDSNLQKANL